MLTHPTLPCPQLVSDLGQVFKLIGGSTGAFFIFGMPGAFLIQVGRNWETRLDVPLLHAPSSSLECREPS